MLSSLGLELKASVNKLSNTVSLITEVLLGSSAPMAWELNKILIGEALRTVPLLNCLEFVPIGPHMVSVLISIYRDYVIICLHELLFALPPFLFQLELR